MAGKFSRALTSASNLVLVRRTMRTIQDVITFLKGGQKRTTALKNAISAIFPDYNKTTLVSMCTTRWVEGHDAVVRFVEVFPAIIQALGSLEQEGDTETSNKAYLLGKRVKEFEFIISMLVIKFVAGSMLVLSEKLQKPTRNLVSVCELIDDDKRHLNFSLENSNVYNEIFSNACRIASDLEISPQTRNIRSSSAEEVDAHYNTQLFRPYLQMVLNELSVRFSNHFLKVAKLSFLIPINIAQLNICSNRDVYVHFGEVLDLHRADLLHPMDCVLTELHTWSLKWQQVPFCELPDNLNDALSRALCDLYPNIHRLLKVFLTIPCTTASVERTFSGLKRLKTVLRNRCGEERLGGIALMALHRDAAINYSAIVDEFLLQKRK
uniref:zinc finger MYM-type protein 1-like n=1 Tax=Ciona intestinalis TaxID=7719 RepID=UPI000EF4BC5B|nr:zinc finger MYM-type protein 1-like [Ciona intestinalis]|eukprot:XP_026695310.1 zinc finger MYM-type protein 1-like [Ciona intestinalis]